MIKLIIFYVLFINILTFLIYGIDKSKAKRNKWRISEKFLLILSLLGGCYGAVFAMNIFKHKTKKTKFSTVNYLTIILWTIGLIWVKTKL